MPYVEAVLMLGEWVDFHYEVNGKVYDFSIPGGGFASLCNLVEALGINETGADKEVVKLKEDEVSESTKRFVEDVKSVEFSSPDLVWVGKTDAETTVGKIKESRGLAVEYSAELTKEQIAEINSRTVEAGDWALISLHPFTSEETLTVTMKNEDQFVVKVTDAQIQKNYISASGETYTITVTYGLQAGIPEGAVLWVDEILPDDEGYEPYVTDAASMIYCDVEELSHIRIFDISILSSDGEKIEPLEPVHVKITYNTPVQLEESQEVATIHFGETEPEVIDTRVTNLPSPPDGCTIRGKSADVPTIQLMIANTPGAALPNTGGPGTTAFYLLGIMLTAFAGTGLMMRKRRRDAA